MSYLVPVHNWFRSPNLASTLVLDGSLISVYYLGSNNRLLSSQPLAASTRPHRLAAHLNYSNPLLTSLYNILFPRSRRAGPLLLWCGVSGDGPHRLGPRHPAGSWVIFCPRLVMYLVAPHWSGTIRKRDAIDETSCTQSTVSQYNGIINVVLNQIFSLFFRNVKRPTLANTSLSAWVPVTKAVGFCTTRITCGPIKGSSPHCPNQDADIRNISRVKSEVRETFLCTQNDVCCVVGVVARRWDHRGSAS
jgi:hypothetical protein